MRTQIVIGLAGYIGSGKTSVSEWFITNHGFKRVSFADPIRQMIMALGVPESVLRDPVLKEKPHKLLLGQTPRYAMETLGTKWGRDLMHPQFWVGHFALASAEKPFVIIDDVRFDNEVEAIESLGGRVFRLNVPGREPKVPTDFMVQKLTKVTDLSNDFETGGVTTKALYERIYGEMFGQPQASPGAA